MGHCGSTDMAVIGVYHYLWCSLRRSLDRTSSGRMRAAATSASHRDGIDNASTSSRMRAVSSASGLMRIDDGSEDVRNQLYLARDCEKRSCDFSNFHVEVCAVQDAIMYPTQCILASYYDIHCFLRNLDLFSRLCFLPIQDHIL